MACGASRASSNSRSRAGAQEVSGSSSSDEGAEPADASMKDSSEYKVRRHPVLFASVLTRAGQELVRLRRLQKKKSRELVIAKNTSPDSQAHLGYKARVVL